MTTLTEHDTTGTGEAPAAHTPSLQEQVHGLAETVRRVVEERDEARDALERVECVDIALRNEIERQGELIADLDRRAVEAEAQRDKALAAAFRLDAANTRLSGELRRAHERVGRQKGTIARLRRAAAVGLTREVLDRIDGQIAVAARGPEDGAPDACGCLTGLDCEPVAVGEVRAPVPADAVEEESPADVVAHDPVGACDKADCGVCVPRTRRGVSSWSWFKPPRRGLR